MQKGNGFPSALVCAISISLAASAAACLAQGSAVQDGTAERAHALMVKAARVNALPQTGMQPWHMRVHYQAFNPDGSLKSEGLIEEFWASPTQVKVTWASGDERHAEYTTDRGKYLKISSAYPDINAAGRVQMEMAEPMPPVEEARANQYAIVERETGSIAATCVQQKGYDDKLFGPAWCVDQDTGNLLITANDNREDALRSNPIKFQGHTIASDLKFSSGELKNIQSDLPAFSAHVEVIEPLGPVDQAEFVPPADARPEFATGVFGTLNVGSPGATPTVQIPKQVNISGGVAQGLLEQKVAPVYPADAKAA